MKSSRSAGASSPVNGKQGSGKCGMLAVFLLRHNVCGISAAKTVSKLFLMPKNVIGRVCGWSWLTMPRVNLR